jgi:hypothetical protein
MRVLQALNLSDNCWHLKSAGINRRLTFWQLSILILMQMIMIINTNKAINRKFVALLVVCLQIE